MKRLLLLAVIVGSGSLAYGQAGSPARARVDEVIQRMFADGRLRANEIRRGTDPVRFHLRGAVTISEGPTTIAADEADVLAAADGSMRYDLRGNVQVTVTPTP